MEPTFSPSQIFDLLGIEPAQLRDWRRRGLMRDVGEPVNHGQREDWQYLSGDLLALGAVRELSADGLMISVAFEVALALRPWLEAHLDMKVSAPDLIILFRDGDGHIVSARMDDLRPTGTLSAMIVDLQRIADRLPGALKDE